MLSQGKRLALMPLSEVNVTQLFLVLAKFRFCLSCGTGMWQNIIFCLDFKLVSSVYQEGSVVHNQNGLHLTTKHTFQQNTNYSSQVGAWWCYSLRMHWCDKLPEGDYSWRESLHLPDTDVLERSSLSPGGRYLYYIIPQCWRKPLHLKN